MKFQKGLFIYNEQAGKNNVPIHDQIIPVLEEAVLSLDTHSLSEPGGGEKICAASGEDYDVIIIYGGDGTVHDCVNGLAGLANRPAVLVLPGGTCNDFSRSLQVPEELDAACRLLKTGVLREVDIGEANGRFFTNFWGIGMIAETSDNIDETKKAMFGKMSYYMSALETVRNPSFFHYELTVDDVEVTKGEAVMVLVLNGNYIGTVDLPFNADHEDGLLDVIVVKESGFPVIKELLQSKRIKVTGEHVADVEHYRVTSFSVKTSEPMPADMDGEVYEQTPADGRIYPKHIAFVCLAS